MIRSLGSLGELFPDTDLRCRIRGCNNVWRFSGEDALRSVALGKSARPERMCDECFETFQGLVDKEVPCAREGCKATWSWNRFQQLEALRQGRGDAVPHGLCRDCHQKLREIGDLEVPCRMKGCQGKWLWRARERLAGDPEKPPRRLCPDCFEKLRDLQDAAVPCRMKGCPATWSWNRFQQLEHLLAGKPLDRPPRRMCDACFASFQQLKDQPQPCRIRECGGAWVYTAYEQLERRLAAQAGRAPAAEPPRGAGEGPVGPEQPAPDGGAVPTPEAPPVVTDNVPAPERFCPECFAFYNSAVDQAVPCRNRGCTHTWTYTRMMQLRLRFKGLQRPPARTCETCQETLKALKDREIKCVVPGCSRTWTYAAPDQLRDQLTGRAEPPGRRCRECETFLAEHQSVTIPCVHCGKDIQWSGYEQLLCGLGTFKKPSMCLACTEQLLALGRRQEPERIEHHLIIRVPSAGRWHEDELIRDRPLRMGHDILERMERADLRIVCIGDEQTYSLDDEELSWPSLLQARLCEQYGGDGKVAVLNAGIAFCTTAQGVVRFPRDVVPFQPHLVVFSFSLADARLYWHREEKVWRAEHSPEAMMAAFERFCECLKRLSGKGLYWTPNPIFPAEQGSGDAMRPSEDRSHLVWANAQAAALEQTLRVAHQCCSRYGVPVLDVRSRFEVNGSKSARKWMSNWYLHNDVGARNVATWVAEYAVREGLLPAPPTAPAP